MDNRVEVLSNIKAISLTVIFIGGIVAYFMFMGIVINSFMINESPMLTESGDPEWDNSVNDIASKGRYMIFGLWAALIFILAKIYGALQLYRLKKTGLIIFHTTSTLLLFILSGGIWYFISTLAFVSTQLSDPWDGQINAHFNQTRFLIAISYSILLGIIGFAIIRTNIILARPLYRREFK